jgi:uncharacterized protein YheU (UPF0270 family)
MEDERYLAIPPQDLAPETLRTLVEEFVTRDGTDYGETEVSLDDKVEEVLEGIRRKCWVIVFDTLLQSVTILDARDWQRGQSDGSRDC